MNYSPTIQKLIDLLSNFPTVGPKTAARFVFYLLKTDKKEVDELILSISNLKRNIKTCSLCFNSFESKNSQLCEICSNPSRSKNLLCIVEKETDLKALEKIKKYKGRYFVLGGTVSLLKKQRDKKLKIEQLKKMIKDNSEIKEIIIATNSNTEGEATALFLERELNPLNKKITRLARGLPVGGELEYADGATLKSALEDRK
ncbi:MAG: recombination mediator RecR [Patescibacteria group bacterium]|nr:recombination mediator RecR [Patescibacteria group bacterium]